jgi:hypothetical protein
MMSDMEKSTQIGELVQQRQSAVIALEHLKLKSKKIAAAYSSFAHNQERWKATESEQVFLLFPKGEEAQHPQYLLGQADLAEHIRETVAAEAALASVNTKLSNLGITV